MNDQYRMLTKIVRNMKLKKNRMDYPFNDNEAETLRYVTKHQGITSSEIVTYLNVDKALVARIIKKLVSNNYLEIKLLADKRKKHLFATKQALVLKLDDQAFENHYYESLFKVISEVEKQAFLETLEKLYLESKRIRKMTK